MKNKIDVIIPLSMQSFCDNDELRILLRSLELFAEDLGRIIICCPFYPNGFQNIQYLQIDDPITDNKDANIINKVYTALKQMDIKDDFIFASDDCCLLKKIQLAKIPPIYNCRKKQDFIYTNNRWEKRLYNTFIYLEKKGIILNCNYQSHTPQRFNGELLINALESDFYTEHQLTINTLFYGLLGITDGELQQNWKLTYEQIEHLKHPLQNKVFVGYNDTCFLNGLRERLFELFPNKSKYEI